jgi:hypothetical protein
MNTLYDTDKKRGILSKCVFRIKQTGFGKFLQFLLIVYI